MLQRIEVSKFVNAGEGGRRRNEGYLSSFELDVEKEMMILCRHGSWMSSETQVRGLNNVESFLVLYFNPMRTGSV